MNTANPLPQVLGWLFGGLSMFIVLGSLMPLIYHSSLHYLLFGYSAVLATCLNFIKYIIDLPWFSVSFYEQHLLIILVVCQSVFFSIYRDSGRYTLYAVAVALLLTFYWMVFGLIPDSFLLLPTAVGIVSVAGSLYLERSGDVRAQGYGGNLAGMTIFFFIIATINYVLTF